jgi:hypothetical protein
MNRSWVNERLFRIAEDYWKSFEAWGFRVELGSSPGPKGTPFLVVRKK